MNKAFVREPDATDARCPRCGSPGQAVSAATLEAHLAPDVRSGLSSFAAFCPYPACEVAYFDMFERVVLADALGKPIYPKDPAAPICACFGLTRDDIEDDVREGVVTRVKALLTQAQSTHARCSLMAANGQSCIPEVQRCYMQLSGKT